MSNAIRIALILVAVTAIVTTISSYVDPLDLGGRLSDLSFSISSFIVTLTPYIYFGKSLLNILVGSSDLASFYLVFVIAIPIITYVASLISKVFKKIVG